jgi:hypothetical protein
MPTKNSRNASTVSSGNHSFEFVLRRLTGENLKPRDLFLAAKSSFDCGIEHSHARGPDIRPGAIAADEWNYGLIRNIQFSVLVIFSPAGGATSL